MSNTNTWKFPTLKDLFQQKRSVENPSVPLTFSNVFGFSKTASGVSINEETALTISAVWRAVDAIASQIATLPAIVYKRQSQGKERQPNHPVAELLSRPNPFMNPSTFFHTLDSHVELWGNAYAWIERNNAAQPVALWPLRPERVGIIVEEQGTKTTKSFLVTLPEGESRKVSADNMLHMMGPSHDGIAGRGVINKARESLGLTSALEQYGARFFSNGANSSVVIKFPAGTRLTDKTISALRESWADMQQGLENAHKTVILADGAEIDKISIPPDDAQFLQSRKFQTLEVARWFGIPPHLLYDLDRATFSNIEQQSLEFDLHTLRPRLVRWEEELTLKLFSEQERKAGFFIEFLIDAFLRADTAARGEFYSKLFNMGAISPNEIRARENLPQREGGDEFFTGPNAQPSGAPQEAPAEEERSRTSLEKRSRHEQLQRRRDASKPLFEQQAQTVLRREIDSLKKILRQNGSREALNGAIEEFYQDFGEYVSDKFLTAVSVYAKTVASEEGPEPEDFDEFLRGYSDNLAAEWTGSSAGQLQALETNEEIEQRLSEWEETRPTKIANRHTVELEGAVKKAVWAASGVTVMRWVSNPGACPLCEELNGRTVSIKGAFVRQGDNIEGDPDTATLTSRQVHSHPPLHRGCTCTVERG